MAPRKKSFYEITRGHPRGSVDPTFGHPHAYVRTSTTTPAERPSISAFPAPVKFSKEASLKRLEGYRRLLEHALTKDTPNHAMRQMVINNLLKLSIYGFEYEGEFEASGIEAVLARLCGTVAFGTEVRDMARELAARWAKQDFERKILSTLPEAERTPEPEVQWGDVTDGDDYSIDNETTPESSRAKIEDTELYRNMWKGIARAETELGRKFLTIRSGFQRPSNVFGHNDIALGAWWPMQLCARRDGAHGAPIAGIYGQIAVGAFSVVCSGGSGYEESDTDRGYEILYSGSSGKKKGDEGSALVTTNDTMKLMKSSETKTPVRVLRGKGASRWAPLVGIRYDGLYTVEGYRTAKRVVKVGEAVLEDEFWQFQLLRCPGQESLESIKARSPTKEEVSASAWFKQGGVIPA